VVADPERLSVGLDALVENAVKNTRREDSIELSVRREDLDPPVAPWENQGGTEEREGQIDLCRGTFAIDPVPPFQLDLSAWALRRRSGNTSTGCGCGSSPRMES
jgi:signal transduction histidine kinase